MTQATDDVYYLYVGNGWSGPFRLEQIKLFVKEKQITPDTFAFEPQQQMQLTVGQLLMDPSEANTGAYQSATAPNQAEKEKKERGPKSTRMDAYDAKQTQVNAKSDGSAASRRAKDSKDGKSGKTARPRHDDSEIDLNITTSTPNSKKDEDSFDLDAVATVRGKYQDDSFDLDGPKTTVKGKFDEDSFDIDDAADLRDLPQDHPQDHPPLEVQVDEPAGRPAGKTTQGQPYQPQAGSQDALEVVLGELENLRRAYNALMEHSIKDREEAQGRVHIAHLAINEVLEERKADIAEVRSLIAEIDEVASDLAKQHKDKTLSTRIIRLRDSLHDTDVSQMVQFAEAVLRRIVEQSDRQGREKSDDPFAAFDGDVAPVKPPSSKTVANTARLELNNTQTQLAELKKAYDQLHDTHTQGQNAAREELLKATALLESEQHAHQQDAAEARSLAAEIYRLACELDPKVMAPELTDKISRLWDELGRNEAATTTAEDVLIGMVKGLRDQNAKPAGDPPTGEISSLKKQVKELGAIRAELLQTRTDLSMMRQREQALQEEKLRLQGLLDEQKQISEKAQQAAKAREQRLRSTVTALEVTKELHQEVMRDLQTQLGAAQSKVEEMERELHKVRGDLTSRRAKKDQGTDLHAEMRRVVELRAMLDARKHELSADLKSTEAELQRVTSDPAAAEDHSLAEMLAAKVNHLRQTFEQTQKRLNDQEAKAVALQTELDASRREAGELRGRSDVLNTELEGARANLSSAKKRAEELNLAYERLEAERESLHKELTHRKSTTRIFRSDGTEVPSEPAPIPESELLAQVSSATVRAETLEAELARERRRAQDLTAEQEALQARIRELAQDRDHVRAELERLTEERGINEQRHASAMANATQAAIEAETSRAKAEARIAELEGKAGGPSAPSTDADIQSLQLQLAEARDQARSAVALLADARAAVAATAFSDAGKQISDQVRAKELADRLVEAEKDVESAANQREDVQAKLAQSVQDRARLNAEIDRLRRELESAANEHRASLQSARNRLVEEQERAESVERELAEVKSQMQVTASQRESINVTMAQAISAKDRLATEVQRLAGQIADQSADKTELAKRLAAEQAALAQANERIAELERMLATLEAEASDARIKVPELEARLTRSQAERQQFLSELDRLRGELVTASQQREAVESGHAEQQKLATQAADSLRQLQAVGEQRDRLQAHLDATKAELERLRVEFSELGQRESAHADALSRTESRLAVESTRYQTADQLLQQARDQYRTISGERDQTRLELAESQASRNQLEAQLKRLRTELDQIKARLATPGTEQDHMQSIADQARIGALEQELQDANRQLRDLALRETQRMAMLAAERDDFARELTALRTRSAGPASAVAEALERELAQARHDRETSVTEAAATRMKLEAVTRDYQRLDAQLTELKSDPLSSVRALETTKRRLARARRRIRALESGRGDALTSKPANSVATEEADLTALRQSAAFVTPGAVRPALRMEDASGRSSSPSTVPLTTSAPASLFTSQQYPSRPAEPTTGKPFTSPTHENAALTGSVGTGTSKAFVSSRGRPTVTVRATTQSMIPAVALTNARNATVRHPTRTMAILIATAACAALTVVVLPMAFTSSKQAVVNARVWSIQSPITGTLTLGNHGLGDTLNEQQALAMIDNAHVDTSTLDAMTASSKDLAARRDRLAAMRVIHDAALAVLRKADELALAKLESAREQLKQEGARLPEAARMAEVSGASIAALQRIHADTKLADTDWSSLVSADKTIQQKFEIAKQANDQAAAEVGTCETNLASIAQSLSQEEKRMDALQKQIAEVEAECAVVSHKIELESTRVARLKHADLTNPRTGKIWRILAPDHSAVSIGDPIAKIADSSSIAIDVSVKQSVADSIHVGDTVLIRLRGDSRTLEGIVEAQNLDAGIGEPACVLQNSSSGKILHVSIPETDTRLIGRGAKATFLGNDPGLIHRSFAWLYEKISF